MSHNYTRRCCATAYNNVGWSTFHVSARGNCQRRTPTALSPNCQLQTHYSRTSLDSTDCLDLLVDWLYFSCPSPVQSFLASFSSRSMPKIFILALTCTDFENETCSPTKELSIFLRMRYVCCTVVSARVYPHCHGVQVTMDSLHPSSLFCECRLVQQVII
jgi:hypothetical protein